MNHTHSISILQVLAYYDVFNFPLDIEEILAYSTFSKKKDVLAALHELELKKVVYKLDEFYSLHNDFSLTINRRTDDIRAKEYEFQAHKKSGLIAKFPFVKGVFISGSLSKGTMSEDGDIDFFVVTQKNRLWISRTLLLLYRLVFLRNSRKYFCINYLVDEEHLKLSFKNRFTATELITLIPMVNGKLLAKMIKLNSWYKEFYPNLVQKHHLPLDYEISNVQRIVEPILNLKIFNFLENWLLKTTIKRWNWKFGHLSKSELQVAFLSSKGVSKQHSGNFQKMVLKGFDDRMIILEKKLTQTYSDLKLKEA